VIDKAASGFSLEITELTGATPAAAYQQFLKVSDWWLADHTWFGKSENLSIEPKAGGCLCEIDGDRQVMHLQVALVLPDSEIQFLGGLGPLQSMGVYGAMTWKFTPDPKGSKITLTYHVTGFTPAGLDHLAAVVDKVLHDQVNALVAKLSSTRP